MSEMDPFGKKLRITINGLQSWRSLECYCGRDAVYRVIYLWLRPDGDYDEGKTALRCAEHGARLLTLWNRVNETAPDAVADLRVVVGSV